MAGDVYPTVYKTFVETLTLTNLDTDFFMPYSCIVATDFYDHLLFSTTTPALVAVVLFGSHVVAQKRNGRSASAMRTVANKHQAAAIYLASFVYSPVSYKLFQTFACDKLDDGATYLRVDYSLSCSTARHQLYEVYALAMIFVYPIGIAGGFAWLLGRNRHDLVKAERETMVHLTPFAGLWAAYKPSRFFYEVVECGRRISLTVIAAFVLPNSVAQISIALLFAAAFVFISEAISPFGKTADMNLYRWGNAIIVTSMYVAFLMKVDVGYDTNYALVRFSHVLITANVLMVITVFLQTVFLIHGWRKSRKVPCPVDTPVRHTYGH